MCPRSEKQFAAMRRKSKRAIRNGSLKLFARKGFSRTTMEDIARQVGISKGLIYNYFTGKEEVLESLIDEFVERIMPAPLPQAAGADPAKHLERLIRVWFHEVRRNPDLIRIGVQFHSDFTLRKIVRRKQAEIERTYAGHLEEVFRRLGSPDPAMETLLLGAVLDGISLNYVAAPEKFPIDKIEQHLIRQYCTPRGKLS